MLKGVNDSLDDIYKQRTINNLKVNPTYKQKYLKYKLKYIKLKKIAKL